MVRGYAGVEQRDPKFLNPLPEHISIEGSILLEFQQKIPVMTSMSEVIGVTRNDISFSARHGKRVGKSRFPLKLEKGSRNEL